METELEILQQIDRLHQWLLQEPNGRFEHGQLWQPDGYLYCRKAEELFELVRQLRDNSHPDYITITNHEIDDILGDEINLVNISYCSTQKSKVTQRERSSFVRRINDANSTINRHLYTLFEHIKEVNNATNS